VSQPVEDICKDCYTFANCHRYLANHTMGRNKDDGNGNFKGNSNNSDNDNGNGERSSDGRSNDGKNNDDSKDVSNVGVLPLTNVDLNCPEAASTKADEERELMLLQAAVHIKMASAQRALYQAKVADVVADATAGKEHSVRRYTFVVDYGQNMELPVYSKEQPGCTYYISPMSIYNLGVVDHARVSEHLHCHVYTKGVSKKGANNVALLIIKTLQKLNLLHKDSVGGELNIIFDNSSGQNKNNTVLKLPAWLMAMGYFKEINFIFLVVGHTKNAADHLFNLLKQEYWKQNLFTFDELVQTLDKLLSLIIHPTVAEDFLDYSKLLDSLYWPLTRNIKTNHIFSCTDDGTQITIRQSNLEEHQEYVLNLWKRGTWNGVTWAQLIEHADKVLKPIKCVELNPYKVVEMYKNYRPNVPIEYQSDVMYTDPSEEVWSKVKVETTERSEFRTNLKAKKYARKEQIESMAFGNGEAKM
jgi:hypothetical protein